MSLNSNFGVTPTGFVKKRLQDIKVELEQEFTAAYGQINTEPDSVFGQVIGVESKVLASNWEAQEAVYYSQYPASAEGTSLDNVAMLMGISRLPATPTRVIGAALGAEGTAIPINTLASIPQTNASFRSTKRVVITRSNALQVVFAVTEVQDNAAYTILVSNKVVAINSETGNTVETLASQLSEAINSAFLTLTCTVDGAEITCKSKDGYIPFSLITGSFIEVRKVWTPVDFESIVTGPVLCPKETLTRIDTPISGLEQITNFAPGVLGTNIESDRELRKRRANSLRIGGAATVESIKARMFQEVSGVSAVTIFENRKHTFDSEGRPPHSFETIVSGGSDLDVANQIWKTKPAGIETFGNIGVIIKDSQGDEHMMYFSRPVDVYFWIRCTIYLYDEEQFPADGLEVAKEILFLVGDQLGVGQDVIIQRFHGPIYRNIAGIGTVVIEIGHSDRPDFLPTEYTDQNVDISAREVAKFSRDRINVILGAP